MPNWPWSKKVAPKAAQTTAEKPALVRNIAVVVSTTDGDVKGVMKITTRDQELYDRPELVEAAQAAAEKVLGGSSAVHVITAAARGHMDLYQSIQSTLKPLYSKEVPSFQVANFTIVD